MFRPYFCSTLVSVRFLFLRICLTHSGLFSTATGEGGRGWRGGGGGRGTWYLLLTHFTPTTSNPGRHTERIYKRYAVLASETFLWRGFWWKDSLKIGFFLVLKAGTCYQVMVPSSSFSSGLNSRDCGMDSRTEKWKAKTNRKLTGTRTSATYWNRK